MSSSEKSTRRAFVKKSAFASLAAAAWPTGALAEPAATRRGRADGPVVIASANGLEAVRRAYELLEAGQSALDAALGGVRLVEEDPEDVTVGYGGLPNEEGVVQLDAAVMDGPSHGAGAVAALEGVKHPSHVARLVMERTDHVLLVGEGAQRFARMHGVLIENLLTEKARRLWVEWKETLSNRDDYLPPHALDDEDIGADLRDYVRHYGTIHCSALTAGGDLGAVTTTSGLAYKMPGRVGDSPIIGAGLYADNDVGAAGSTGRGEANLKNCSSFLIVERMRAGDSPQDACLYACERIAQNTLAARLRDDAGRPGFNVKFYAVRKDGAFGGAQIRGTGGQMAVADADGARLVEIPSLF